ncbi:hypothetical protein [Rufibacter roseus]|uniref:Uncharacterized protein n=1 Tax=Rufibacter roseus TaxID=1567108 RepID=A0ABW2DR63_9BACT|nr:hypothetical protein [Rufibacter roseus]
MWVIKFENGGEPYWIADGHGDPARTLVKENAKAFRYHKEAKAALWDVIKNNPHRYYGKPMEPVIERK